MAADTADTAEAVMAAGASRRTDRPSGEHSISIGLLARDLHRLFNRALDQSVGRYGLASHTTRYLGAIGSMGGASPSELSKYFGVRSPTTLAALQVLEQKRLIVRTQDPNDKRRSVLQLTPKGAKIKDLALECVHDIEDTAATGLSPEDIVKFGELVGKIRDSLLAELARQDETATIAARDED